MPATRKLGQNATSSRTGSCVLAIVTHSHERTILYSKNARETMATESRAMARHVVGHKQPLGLFSG